MTVANTYNTSNPLGSADPRDAYDNSSNFDEFSNSTSPRFNDRFGVSRRTISGINQAVVNYVNRGEWTTATAYQINDIWRDGPTGAFYLVLADYTSSASAATDIASGNVTVQQPKDWVVSVSTMADLIALGSGFDGQKVHVSSYHDLPAPLASKGGGTFIFDTSRDKTDHDGGNVITPEAVFPTNWDGDPTARFVWLNYAEYVAPGTGCWDRANNYEINVCNFGAKGNGTTDDCTSLQFATYATKNYTEGGPIPYYLPAGRYSISKPILFYSKDGLRIRGDGKVASVIIPTGPMTPLLDPNFIALQALGYDDYTAVPACFIISTARLTGPNEVWTENLSLGQWHIEVDGIGFIGDATTRTNVVGIYGPVMASARFDNILYKNLLHGFKSEIFWRTSMRNCDFTWLNGTPISMEDSATRGATGTSVCLENCGSYYTRGGFYLKNCHYSVLTGCAVDHWVNNIVENGTVQTYAYQFDGCKGLVMNGCGAEDGKPLSTKGIFNFFGQYGSTTINGGSFAITGNPSPVEVSRMDDDHYLSINNALYKNDPNSVFGSYFQLESGRCVVNNLVDSNVYSTVFGFSNTVDFYGGRESLKVIARDTSSAAMVPSTTSKISFGARDASQSPYHYDSFDESAEIFTAPFGGEFKVDVTVRFLGSGVETVRLYKNGVVYDTEPNFFPSTTNVQTYTFSASISMTKGATIYAELVTTAGATGSTTFAQLSVAQIS